VAAREKAEADKTVSGKTFLASRGFREVHSCVAAPYAYTCDLSNMIFWSDMALQCGHFIVIALNL
jgi:hypothetical protein